MNRCTVMIGDDLRCSLIAGHGGHHLHIADKEDEFGLYLVTEAIPVDEVHVWSGPTSVVRPVDDGPPLSPSGAG